MTIKRNTYIEKRTSRNDLGTFSVCCVYSEENALKKDKFMLRKNIQ